MTALQALTWQQSSAIIVFALRASKQAQLSLAWQVHEMVELAERKHGWTAAPIKQEVGSARVGQGGGMGAT